MQQNKSNKKKAGKIEQENSGDFALQNEQLAKVDDSVVANSEADSLAVADTAKFAAADSLAQEQATVGETNTADTTVAEQSIVDETLAADSSSAEQAPVEDAEQVASDAEVSSKQKTKKAKGNKPFVDRAKNIINGEDPILDKTEKFLKGKGKLPVFIGINVLYVLISVMLLVSTFAVAQLSNNAVVHVQYNLFGYFGSADAVKAGLALVMGLSGVNATVNAAYAAIAAFALIAILAPILIVIKNVVLLFVTHNKLANRLDALAVFALVLLYACIVNVFGADITFGIVLALVIGALTLACVLARQYLVRSTRAMPIYSLLNVLMLLLTAMMFSGKTLYGIENSGYYAAAASVVMGGTMGTVFLIAVVLTLVIITANVILQYKRFSPIVMYSVNGAMTVCATVSIILAIVASTSIEYALNATMVIGYILVLITLAYNLVFNLVKKLPVNVSKYIDDSELCYIREKDTDAASSNEELKAAPAVEEKATEETAPAVEEKATEETAQAVEEKATEETAQAVAEAAATEETAQAVEDKATEETAPAVAEAAATEEVAPVVESVEKAEEVKPEEPKKATKSKKTTKKEPVSKASEPKDGEVEEVKTEEVKTVKKTTAKKPANKTSAEKEKSETDPDSSTPKTTGKKTAAKKSPTKSSE